MYLSLVLLVLVVLVVVCFYFRWSRWARLLAKIPGPTELPIIGHAWLLRNMNRESSFIQLRQWAKQFKRIYTSKMVWRVAVNIFHPDDIETIYSNTAHNEKQLPYNFLKPWLCEGLLISNGDKWKQRRKLLTPAFHFNILKRFCITFNEQTERFLKWVELEVNEEKTEIMPLITKATLNIMCETSMGISVKKAEDSITNKYFNSLYQIGNLFITRYFTAAYHLDWIYNLFNSKKENKLIMDLHNFTDKIIQERKSFRENNDVARFDEDSEVYITGKERLAMLDLLLENERDGKIDMKGIREEVDTFLFEGHDTTAAALSFMIMRIANERHVQKKIYEELVQVFGNSSRLPTTNDLNELKYLESCIKESLRLYPSVYFMARCVHEDVMLGGFVVPGGTVIHVHVYDLHHDPVIYPDPEKFDPDRFSPEQVVRRHPYAYIPFSAGPRNCIGQKFAMLEMKTLMSGLLRRFRLEPVTEYAHVVFINDLVLRSKHPLYVRFRARSK